MRVLSIRPDHDKGAGYALIELDEAEAGELELAFYDVDHGYLWPSSSARTIWRNEPYHFKAVRADESRPTFRIGHEICNYLAPDSLIELRSPDGELDQSVTWDGVPTLESDEEGGPLEPPPRPPPRPGPGPGPDGTNGPKPESEQEPETGKGDVSHSAVEKVSAQARPQKKWWLKGSLGALVVIAATFFMFAVSHGLDWQVSAPDPIIFQQTVAGVSPDSVAISIKRAWWSAWIDRFIDSRVELVTDGAVYASDYQPSRMRTVELHLRLPARTGETNIAFRHIATDVSFGKRRVIVRNESSPPPPTSEMVITTAVELKFSGAKGGPFVPVSIPLKIISRGPGFSWSVARAPDWLGFSKREGALSPGGSQEILLTTNAEAVSMDSGSYTGNLIITSLNSTISKTVLLEVQRPQNDSVAKCDELAGSRFDTDRPDNSPPVDNMLAISDSDIDTAISTCGDAAKATGLRRFYAELGRAYATKAEKQAISGEDAAAYASMEQALSAWGKAASMLSGSAENFLGAYYGGTYNDEVAPGRARATLPPFTFVSPDPKTSLHHYLRSAQFSNVNGMRNAGSLLLGDTDPPPPFQSVPDGVQWLRKAIAAGDSKAAVVLGKAFYTGSPRDVLHYTDHSLSPKDQALQLLGKACSDGSDLIAKYSAKEFVNKITSQTYGGGGGRLDASHRPTECSSSG